MEERDLMSEEEFEDYLGVGQLKFFEGSRRFRSVRRAIKRGHVSPLGEIYPDRPFSNKKRTKGRSFNERKKDIYGQLKQRGL